MTQIDDFQARIAAALDRIGAGVDVLTERLSVAAEAAAAAEPETLAEPDPELVAALEDERIANAQLEERLRALKKKHAAELEALQDSAGSDPAKDAELELLRSEVAKQSDMLAQFDQDLQRLRAANDQLRDVNAALRDANAEGVGEPHLINKAMLAELEGLRAARNADAAEADAILGKLEPLLAAAATHLPDLPDAENEESH